jgi:hypothetical protein
LPSLSLSLSPTSWTDLLDLVFAYPADGRSVDGSAGYASPLPSRLVSALDPP